MHPARLDSWKEIAAHLGRTVRTVQRWEHDLGLPVHRVPGRKRDMVFALAHELDAWLSSGRGTHALAEPRGPESGEVLIAEAPIPDSSALGAAALDHQRHSTPEGAAPSSLVNPSPPQFHQAPGDRAPVGEVRESSTRRWAWAGGGLAVGVALMYVVLLAAGVVEIPAWAWSANPADWDMDERHLIVLDGKGREIWRKRFEVTLDPVHHKKVRRSYQTQTVGIHDLDGDERNEVLIVVSTPTYARLYCFESDGRLRFTYETDTRKVRFGTQDFSGPWPVHKLLVTKNPDGESSIWVASIHNLEFPSVVEKVDFRGKKIGTGFWHAGHDSTMQEGMYNGRRVIFVGYLENDGLRSSMAAIDYEKPSGFARAQNEHYQCKSCPVGEPLAFFIFPRTELAQVTNFMTRVLDIRVSEDNEVAVGTLQTTPHDQGGGHQALVMYKFDANLRLREAFSGTSNPAAHEAFRAMGLIDHKYDPAEERDMFPVLKWNGTAFEKIMGPGHSADAPASTRARSQSKPAAPQGAPAHTAPVPIAPAAPRRTN